MTSFAPEELEALNQQIRRLALMFMAAVDVAAIYYAYWRIVGGGA